MAVPKEIFREYDIRGVAGKELSIEVARAIGEAYGGYIREKGALKISVGADNRISSPELKAAVIEGLTRAGLDVVDIGTVVTPMVYFSCYHFNFPGGGGVQVTASHNPAADNGIKLREGKKPLFVGGTRMIYERILAMDSAPAAAPPATSALHRNAPSEADSGRAGVTGDSVILARERSERDQNLSPNGSDSGQAGMTVQDSGQDSGQAGTSVAGVTSIVIPSDARKQRSALPARNSVPWGKEARPESIQEDAGQASMTRKDSGQDSGQAGMTGGAGVTETDITNAYIQRITKGIKLGRKLKVVVDTGNGTGGLFVRKILDALGVEAEYVFETSDGRFPNHIPDPQEEEAYGALRARVRASRAELGIALDGDCDRMNATDEQGNFLGSDKLAVLFSREVLRSHPGAGVVVNAVMSQAILDDVEAHGGKGFIGKAGYPNIAARMEETGAKLGNEASGHFFFADEYFGYDDAFYAMVRLLSFVSAQKESVTAVLADMPKYVSTPEYRVDVGGEKPDERKFAIVEELTAAFKKEGYTLNTIDGARVSFPDHGGWGIVRASNTQPKLSMRMEAKTKSGLDAIKETFREKMKGYAEIKLDF